MLQIEDASIAYGNDVLFSQLQPAIGEGERLPAFPARRGVEKHLFSMPYWDLLH